jgi:hypothetical protein
VNPIATADPGEEAGDVAAGAAADDRCDDFLARGLDQHTRTSTYMHYKDTWQGVRACVMCQWLILPPDHILDGR